MNIIKNKLNGLYIYDHKSVVYNSTHAKKFKTRKEADFFLFDLEANDRALKFTDWEILEVAKWIYLQIKANTPNKRYFASI